MNDITTLLADIISNPFAWPGGYERFAVTDDGGALCHQCCKEDRVRVEPSTPGDGFYIVAIYSADMLNEPIACDYCDRVIGETD